MTELHDGSHRGAHAYMLLFSLRFTEVVWVVYLREKGFSYASIGLFETIFHIASFSSELPTGIIADRWGRKASLFLGRVLAAIAAAIVLFAHSWAFLAVSFAINAVSYTCHSGAFDALLYDSLPDDRKSGFTRLMGRINSTYLLGTSLAGVAAAALIARVSLDYLYWASIMVDVMAAVAALSLPEDLAARRVARRDMLAGSDAVRGHALTAATAERSPAMPSEAAGGFLWDVKALLRTLRRRDLRNLLLLWGVVSALGTSVFFYGQSLLKESLVPLSLVPIASTLGSLLAIVPTRSAYRIEERFGQLRAVAGGSFLIPATVLAMGLAPGKAGWLGRAVVVALYLGLIVLQETMYPLFSDAVNTRTGSANRATVLSSGNMMFSVSMMVTFPLIGFVGDRIGLNWGMVAAAVLTTLCLAPVAASLLRERSSIACATLWGMTLPQERLRPQGRPPCTP